MKKLLTALALVAGLFTIAGASASATTVHHQDCPDGWTQIVSQPPHSGFEVKVAYTGNMWIKVSTEHFEVPVVNEGDIITTDSVSSWPTNKRGKYQEISHVDYCIPPEVTTTTQPEVTTTTAPEVTTTTAPEVTTTVAETTTTVAETTTTVGETTTTVAETTTTQPATTSTQATTTSTPPVATPQSLPTTGSNTTGVLASIAGLLVLTGGALTAARRRG